MTFWISGITSHPMARLGCTLLSAGQDPDSGRGERPILKKLPLSQA